MADRVFHRGLKVAALAGILLMPAPAQAAPNDGKTAKPASGAAAASSGESGLKARIESLEEQLVDMQVLIGTLESMSKSGGGGSTQAFAATAAASGDAARIDGLETQVRALTSQIEQLSEQVRGLGGAPKRSDIPATTSTADAAGAGGPGANAVPPNGTGDAIGGMLNDNSQPPRPAGGNPAAGEAGTSGADSAGSPPQASVSTAALPPTGLPPAGESGSADPKQLYETAYGYLLQRDYAQAETAFGEFLKRYPNDSLSGNAQYWLGETHFVRGQYKAAAGDFLKGYQNYAQSAKAPDSLLKLAMSLDRMGQKDAACSSYAELSTKFPKAPQSVKARAQTERQRVGC